MRKLRILLVHNFYGSQAPSGENIAVEAEKKLLESNGNHVEFFSRNSDDIRKLGIYGSIKGGLSTPWNFFSSRIAKNRLESFSPDIVHVHNTFPLISPAVFYSIPANIPRILTLHNYRLYCPSGIPMRANKICSECIDKKNVIPSLRYGCYRGSRIATIPIALGVELHRRIGTWDKKVDGFIALTHFQRQQMVKGGLEGHKVWVKPNFFPGNPAIMPWESRLNQIVFIGRLSPEKGVLNLVKAWRLWSSSGELIPELVIVGDGPLLPELKNMAKGLPIRFTGHLPSAEARKHIAQSKMLILPSEWWEGFPMVIQEAFAYGTPVAASEIGSLKTIVENLGSGILFKPGNPISIYQSLQKIWKNPNLLQELGLGARLKFEESYTEKANYEQLMQIYTQVIAQKNARSLRLIN